MYGKEDYGEDKRVTCKEIGEVIELMRYRWERALDEDVKKVRDFAPNVKLSDIVIKGREEI